MRSGVLLFQVILVGNSLLSPVLLKIDISRAELRMYLAWYAEHNLMILDQLRPREFKGGCATTYGGCLAAPIGVLCLVVYMVDLLRRSVWSASVASAVECWFGSRFGEARIG